MSRMAWGAACLLVIALTARAAEPDGTTLTSSAVVEVDATGKAYVAEMGAVAAAGVAIPPTIAELVQQRLRERIETWQFVPATRDGVAMPSRTRLRVTLSASEDAKGGLAVRIVSASTGSSVREKHLADLIEVFRTSASQAYAVVDVHYAGDGSVIGAEVTDQRVFSNGRFIPYKDRDFRRGLERALKRWTFETDMVGGQGVEGHGRLPIWVCESSSCDIAARALNAEPARRDFVDADPAVKLRSAVAGTAL